MKIPLADLTPTREVEVSGEEDWLQRIYADFPSPSEVRRPPLTGRFLLRLEEAGTVKVTGELAYEPFVNCSRCDLPFSWPMQFSISARFRKKFEGEEDQREHTLSKAELDEYFIVDDLVDLEELINDTVQTALPTQIVPDPDVNGNCSVCKEDISSIQVYGLPSCSDADEEESPFAVLRNLKLPTH